MTRDLESCLPPNDQAAEKSVLGAILREPHTFSDAEIEVSASDFYADAHQRLWRIFSDLSRRQIPIDPVIVFDEIKSRGWAGDINPDYLVQLWEGAPAATNAVFHARIVREKSMLRAIIRVGTEIQQMGFDPAADPDAISAQAGEMIFNLVGRKRAQLLNWEEALDEALAVLDRRCRRAKSGQIEEGLTTGWQRFDRLTGGFHRGELIVIGARPSVGKTMVAINILAAVAEEGYRIHIASLEQSASEVVHRVLSMKSGVNSHCFRTGAFDEGKDRAITDAVTATKKYKVTINAGSGQSIAQVASDARYLKSRDGLDLVVVDYLGLMEASGRRTGSRAEEVGAMTRGAKRLAKDLNVAVIMLAQLNRQSEARVDKKPRLADLRESGDIEQDADTVLMLHKPEAPDDKRDVDELHIQIEKQRNGPCGAIPMKHYKKTFVIKEAS